MPSPEKNESKTKPKTI